MRSSILALAVLCAVAFALPLPALAQETQPGDACAAGDVHRFQHVGGPENPGTGYVLVCDGSNWKLVTEWDTASGNTLFQVDYDSAACDALKEGRLRYSSSGDLWEYCRSNAWTVLGGGGAGSGLQTKTHGQSCSAAEEGDIAKATSPNGEQHLYCDGYLWQKLSKITGVSGGTCGQTNCGGSSSERVVFVTSTLHDGTLGGVSGADSICQARADAAGYAGTYKAWIADSTDASAPASRFEQATVPYELPNGTKVADNWTDLVDNTLDAKINMDQTGATVIDTVNRWTNVTGSGTRKWAANNCSDWSGTAGNGHYGTTVYTATAEWTDSSTSACTTNNYRLLCFEQASGGKQAVIYDQRVGSLNGVQIGTENICGADSEGTIRYDAALDKYEFCDGSAWGDLAAGGGSLPFPLLANPTGTAGAPAYSFNGDPNTGMYSDAADTLKFAAGGVAGMEVGYTASGVNRLRIIPGTATVPPEINNVGTSTAGAPLGIYIRGKNATTVGAGGTLTLWAGVGNGNGAGGSIALYAGGGGATGSGGSINFSAGSGGATSGSGGTISFVAADAQGTGNGGDIAFTAGNGGFTSGNGGNVSITSGYPWASGNGSNVQISASGGAGTNKNGGYVSITAGASTGSGTPGYIKFGVVPTIEVARFSSAGLSIMSGANPSVALDVTGSIKLTSSIKFGTITGAAPASGFSPAGANTQIQFNSGSAFGASSGLIWDNANSRLGVGATSPVATLDVNGTVNLNVAAATTDRESLCIAVGGGTVTRDAGGNNCDTSSARFKHDIEPIDIDGLGLVSAFNPSSFIYNSDKENVVKWGFIAEEMAAIDPHFAAYDEAGLPYSINKYAIMAVMAEAIKELKAENDNLKAELKTTNEYLLSRIEALERVQDQQMREQ